MKNVMELADRSYEGVCKETGQQVLTIEHFNMFEEKRRKSMFALLKLQTIVEYLNEGEVLDPLKDIRYFPYFWREDTPGGSGLVFRTSFYLGDHAHSGSAARLGLKNRALSDFAGQNFLKEYSEFILG